MSCYLWNTMFLDSPHHKVVKQGSATNPEELAHKAGGLFLCLCLCWGWGWAVTSYPANWAASSCTLNCHFILPTPHLPPFPLPPSSSGPTQSFVQHISDRGRVPEPAPPQFPPDPISLSGFWVQLPAHEKLGWTKHLQIVSTLLNFSTSTPPSSSMGIPSNQWGDVVGLFSFQLCPCCSWGEGKW